MKKIIKDLDSEENKKEKDDSIENKENCEFILEDNNLEDSENII